MNKALKERIDTIHQDPSAVHYVKTEIGILPCDWEVAKLSDIAEQVTQTAGTDYYETVSISAGIGFVNQAKKFGKELSGKQYEKYNVIHKGDFSYNKGNSNKYPQGCIYRLKDRETAAVPNVFESFKIQSECADFYDHLFVSGFLNQQLSKKINHGVRDNGLLNLTEKDFYSCLLPVPPLAEQKKISKILSHYDKLIKLCEAKVNEYKSLKKICLSKIFPQNSSNVPELRFPGFTGAWEQRKLSDEFSDFIVPMRDKPKEFGGNIPWTRIEDIKGKYLNGSLSGQFVSEVTIKQMNLKIIPKDSLIVSSSATFGVAAIITQDLITNQTFIGLVPKDKDTLDFWYTFFHSAEARNYMRLQSAGSTIFYIAREHFEKMPIKVPTKDEMFKIGKYFSDIDRLITLHQREVKEYTRLKKAMTQLLLTGIVRVNT